VYVGLKWINDLRQHFEIKKAALKRTAFWAFIGYWFIETTSLIASS